MSSRNWTLIAVSVIAPANSLSTAAGSRSTSSPTHLRYDLRIAGCVPIAFDHASHQLKHYPEEKQEFACAACHQAYRDVRGRGAAPNPGNLQANTSRCVSRVTR